MQALCQSSLFSTEATSTPLSVSQQSHGPAADGLLHAGTSSARARAWRWRDTRSLPEPLLAQAQHCALARTSPLPCHTQILAHPGLPAHLSSAFLHLPAPSLPILLPAVLLAAATGVELSERATGSFEKGTGWRSCEQGKHSRSKDCWVHSQLFHLLTSCPSIRGLNTLNHKGIGHIWHKVFHPSPER